MAEIQFGLSLPSGMRDKSLRGEYMSRLTQLLDRAKEHYSSAWFIDHLQFSNNDLMEGWTAVSYLSALYPELDWGHAVICQSFRNPALLAKMGATLHYMSGGRFIVGLGAGWKEDEYKAYGYDFPSAGQRVDELDETLQILKMMWTEEQATFKGKYYSVENAYCEPKPDPMPTIMIGASKPRMLKLAARHADWWNASWTGINEFRDQVAQLREACNEIGRDPSSIRLTWFGGCACAPTEREAKELTGGRFGTDTAFVGTPEQIIEQLQPFIDLGTDYFMLGCGGFPDTTTVDMLISEVIPVLKGAAKKVDIGK